MQKNLFDELGQWSIDKLKLLEKYLHAYTVILTKQSWCRGVHYVDGFAGGGKAIDRETQEFIDASPMRAVNTEPPFDRLIFIEKSQDRIAQLHKLRAQFSDRRIEIYEGDCNDIIVNTVIPSIPRNERGFLLLDPYALHIEWQTIEMAARARTVEIMINLPLMAVYRTVAGKTPEDIDHTAAARVTAFWGSEGWLDVMYPEHVTLFGTEQRRTDHIADALSVAFSARLAHLFGHVSDHLIMRNTINVPLYSLIWAGHQPVACKIMNEIFDKYRRENP